MTDVRNSDQSGRATSEATDGVAIAVRSSGARSANLGGQKCERRKGGRYREADIEDCLSRISDAAEAVFIQQGYCEASILAIGKLSGSTYTTIQHKFGTKDFLFRNMIISWVSSKAEMPELNQGELPHSALRRMARYAITETTCDRCLTLIRLMCGEERNFPDMVPIFREKIVQRIHQDINRLFETAVDLGILVVSDPGKSASLFLDLIVGSKIMLKSLHVPETIEPDIDLEERIELFIVGYLDR